MRRILIDDDVRAIASSFKTLLGRKHGTYEPPLTRLLSLQADSKLDKRQKDYVKLIICKWNDLIVLEPPFDAVISEFERKIPANDLAKMKVRIDQNHSREFYKMIVDAMRYDYVQKTLYKDFISDLGIRTCVYCNAQYAFSYTSGKESFQNYEIDHWLPKSKYPYLCTSFFNLQPCCPKCNKMKSSKDDVIPFCLYTHDAKNLNPFKFTVDNKSCASYLVSHDKAKLKINFNSSENHLKNNMDTLFHISTQYQAHKDIVEEIVWKKQIYNKTLLDIYTKSFKDLGFRPSDFNRFIISNYDKEENILKRPFAKMVQDIAKQLGIIK